MFSILRQSHVQTVLVLFLYLCFASYLPLVVHQGFYTISLLIKDLLVWLVPLMVIFFIAHAMAGLERKAPLFVISIIFFSVFFIFTNLLWSYGWGYALIDHLPHLQSSDFNESFTALWHLPLVKPQWWGSDKGCLIGLVLGFIAAFTNNVELRSLLNNGKQIAQEILIKFFGRLTPLFILGFVVHMYGSGILGHVFKNYAVFSLWLIFITAVYVLILFAIGAGWNLGRMVKHIRHLLPAGAIALSSGSSLFTVPWTIKGAAKNLDDPHLAEIFIPATVNSQQMGDCIAQAFFCFVIYTQFFESPPPFSMWLVFSLVFILARFAATGILGGAIFILLPIYEQYLYFRPDMITILLALNIALDPFITSSNVLANGALCRIFEILWTKIKHRV